MCIDLVPLMPRYASADAPVAQAPFRAPVAALARSVPDEGAPVDIDLVEADGVWEHPDATTVSAAVLFEDSDVPSAELDRAARAMASTLRSRFAHGALRWLVPDIANDFTLEVLRRNLNAKFADAQPLPRSVATIFAQVDLDRVTHRVLGRGGRLVRGYPVRDEADRPFRCRAEGAGPGDPRDSHGSANPRCGWGPETPTPSRSGDSTATVDLARADGTCPGRSALTSRS